MRAERVLKLSIYAVVACVFLILLYIANSGENDFSTDARNSAISEYDYYMDEYKDLYDSEGDGTGENFYDDDAKVKEEKKKYTSPDDQVSLLKMSFHQ